MKKFTVDGQEVETHEKTFSAPGWPRPVTVIWSFRAVSYRGKHGMTPEQEQQCEELVGEYERIFKINYCMYRITDEDGNRWIDAIQKVFPQHDLYPCVGVPNGLGGIFCYVFETGNDDEPQWTVFFTPVGSLAPMSPPFEHYYDVNEMIEEISSLRASWCFKAGGAVGEALKSAAADSTRQAEDRGPI